MSSEHDFIDEGLAHQQAGRLAQAEAAYCAALERDSNDADALHLLGVVRHQLGSSDAAIEWISRAIAVDASAPLFHHNLAEAYRAASRTKEAIESYRKALELDSTLIDTWLNLGHACQCCGETAEAARAWEKALALGARDASTLNNLGVAYRRLGRLGDAVRALTDAAKQDASPEILENLIAAVSDSNRFDDALLEAQRLVEQDSTRVMSHVMLAGVLYAMKRYDESMLASRDALRLDPDCLAAHFSLGCSLCALHQFAGALLAFDKCETLKPNQPLVCMSAGLAMFGMGRLHEAIEKYRHALKLDETSYPARLNLCNTMHQAGLTKDAIVESRELIQRFPDDPMAYNLLATLLALVGQNSEADEMFDRGLQLAPESAMILANYGLMLAQSGRVSESVRVLKRARALNPEDPTPHSNLLLYINADPESDTATIVQEHFDWGARHADPLTAAAPPHPKPDPQKKKLRIGYVSPDFRMHSVAYFAEPILSTHNHEEFEIVIYDDVIVPDAMTLHLRGFADEWHRVIAFTHEQLAQKIREDRIDVLVEFAGHTANHRLLALARKPAPIQINYLGYPNTTGMKAIDYRITDTIADPPGLSDAMHAETLLRPSPLFLTFRASSEAPDIGPLPALQNGRITFCSFNAIWKLSEPLVALWSRVLNSVERSQLLIKSTGLGDADTRARILHAFVSNGISEERLELIDRAPSYREHLDLYNRCDIQLDSFPYNGTTTLCEGLWMGVPFITLTGTRHASRVGTTLNAAIGLADLSAADERQFVSIATELANNIERIEQLRSGLRSRMAESPLLHAREFTRRLEDEYRRLWQMYCRTVQSS